MRRVAIVCIWTASYFACACLAAAALDRSPAEIFKQVAPAIVSIMTQASDGQPGQGSGFIVDPNGVIVTACHGMVGIQRATVMLKDGRRFPIQSIINFDTSKDICVVNIEASGVPTVVLGDSDQLEVGGTVFAIGNPLGYDYTMSDGLLSGIRDTGYMKRLQFSAPISSGNSGGALLDKSGRVIGVTVLHTTEGQNLNFAVPINDVKPLIGTSPKMTLAEFGRRIGAAYPHIIAGSKAAADGHVEEAVQHLEEAVRLDPGCVEAYSLLAFLYSQSRQEGHGLESISKGIQYGEQAIRLGRVDYLLVGALYGMRAEAQSNEDSRLHDFGKAEEYFQEALAHNPKSASAYERLGWVSAAREEFGTAGSYYEHALAIDPHLADAHAGLGQVYQNSGKLEQAIDAYQRALEIDPDSQSAHAGLCIAYVSKGDKQSALRELAQLKQIGAVAAAAFLENVFKSKFGTIETSSAVVADQRFKITQQGDSSGIHHAFPNAADSEVIAHLDPLTAGLVRQALDAMFKGEPLRSTRLFEQALATVPKSSQAFNVLRKAQVAAFQETAAGYSKKGSPALAISYYEKAVSLIGSSDDAFLQQKLAECYYFIAAIANSQGDVSKVREYTAKLEALGPKAKRWLEDTAR